MQELRLHAVGVHPLKTINQLVQKLRFHWGILRLTGTICTIPPPIFNRQSATK
jgi:hypothetical protein